MSKSKSIYFAEVDQKVRWTETSTEDFIYDYKYIGEATENEFNILIDLLWHLHEDEKITYQEFYYVYKELRKFCDKIMGLVDEL